MVRSAGVVTHRFWRFCNGSGTGKPVCGSSGSQPKGLEPEPEPVMIDAKWRSASRTSEAAGSAPSARMHRRSKQARQIMSPELRAFIDRVITPTLLERFLREQSIAATSNVEAAVGKMEATV